MRSLSGELFDQGLDFLTTVVTQFGDDIKGIWAANDDMGLAAVETLRAEGKAGKVPVTGFHSTIESPDSVSRVAPPTTSVSTISAATA